jgi:hypothetical protein
MATGDRVRALAESESQQGHQVSARDAFLRAASYYGKAFYFVLGTRDPSRSMNTWETHRAAWDNAIDRWPTPVARVTIPYEDAALKGYLLSPDDKGTPRPLVIMNNGSDGPVNDMLVAGAIDAVSRGYHALIFDGPGQGEALYVQKLYFRPDWEQVITPVVDWASSRPEVDANRIAVIGVSQAGYWVPRAASREHRLAAIVADPGVTQVWTSWWDAMQLPAEMIQLLDGGQKDVFDQYMQAGMQQIPAVARFEYAKRSEPYGFSSTFDLLTAVKKYDLTEVSAEIACPTLITSPENEQFWPGQSQKLYDALTSAPRTLVPFTAAEGADMHCEPLAPQLRNQRIFDWLDGVLAEAA